MLSVTDANGCIKREYDELNRVKKYTDTYGNTIKYEYDEVGNLSKLIYPDNTVVSYTYDANNNMVSVTDWANRVTSYPFAKRNFVFYDIKHQVLQGIYAPFEEEGISETH